MGSIEQFMNNEQDILSQVMERLFEHPFAKLQWAEFLNFHFVTLYLIALEENHCTHSVDYQEDFWYIQLNIDFEHLISLHRFIVSIMKHKK